jgi:2EXR family
MNFSVIIPYFNPHVTSPNPDLRTSLKVSESTTSFYNNNTTTTSNNCLAPDCSVSIAATGKMFTIFPRLPPELRNKVWGFAANNEPRNIDIASSPFVLPTRHKIASSFEHPQTPLATSNN